MVDKSTANGGPPSYDAAGVPPATVASSSTAPPTQPPASSADDATATTPNGGNALGGFGSQSVPRGVTRKEAADPTSSYSMTRVALELPYVTQTKRITSPPAQWERLPPFLLHCTLFASYDLVTPHAVPFRMLGCPATQGRGQPSATSTNKVTQSMSKLRKRLGVQIPLSYLGSPGFNPSPSSSWHGNMFAFLAHTHPRNGAEMKARSGNVGRYHRASLFQAQAKEMTAIVSRPLVERVLTAIYGGQGIYNRMAIFPAEAILRYSSKRVDGADSSHDSADSKPGFFAKLKAKAKGDKSSADHATNSGGSTDTIQPVKSASSDRNQSAATEVRSVKAAMTFVTFDLLAPPPRLLETGGPYPIEMNKASDADMSTSARLISEFDRGTDEDRFKRFHFIPSPADDELFGDMLRALERRGVIWVEAGRLITPSTRNPNPRERARFLVKCLAPERFAYRCKFYRTRKFEPMPSDLDAKEVKRFGAPLIVHQVVERTGNEGVDLKDHVSSSASLSQSSSSPSSDSQDRLDWEWDDEDHPAFEPGTGAGEEGEGAGANDAVPPPDYRSMQREGLNGYGIESARAKALIEAEQDFFKGWSIGVTEEPFKNGAWLESLGTGSSLWFAAGSV